jgi:hypothetical protein
VNDQATDGLIAKALCENQGLVPDRLYFAELKRPWKVATLVVGLTCLFYGALNFGFADWDIGISVLMGVLTYVCAPWTVRVLVACVRGRPRHRLVWFICALFVAWIVVDGSYVAYNRAMGHAMLRAENLVASSALYFLAGILWSYPGSLSQLAADVRRAFE